MSDQEIISVRVHLGDMGKEIMHLESDEERSDWLLGFHAGALGRSMRDGWTPHKIHGFTFGSFALAEAQEFRASKQRGGKASVESRRKNQGSAQPNSPRTEPRTEPEQCSALRTAPEQNPEQSTEQSTEQPPNQPTTYRQQPSSQKTKAATAATSESQAFTVNPRAAPAWKSFSDRCSERRAAWLEKAGPCDFTKRPGKLQFTSYCLAVHPQWRKGPELFDEWAFHGWKYKRKPIESWFVLLDAFAEAADQSEYGERFPMGSISANLNLADGMSARHLAKGEPL